MGERLLRQLLPGRTNPHDWLPAPRMIRPEKKTTDDHPPRPALIAAGGPLSPDEQGKTDTVLGTYRTGLRVPSQLAAHRSPGLSLIPRCRRIWPTHDDVESRLLKCLGLHVMPTPSAPLVRPPLGSRAKGRGAVVMVQAGDVPGAQARLTNMQSLGDETHTHHDLHCHCRIRPSALSSPSSPSSVLAFPRPSPTTHPRSLALSRPHRSNPVDTGE